VELFKRLEFLVLTEQYAVPFQENSWPFHEIMSCLRVEACAEEVWSSTLSMSCPIVCIWASMWALAVEDVSGVREVACTVNTITETIIIVAVTASSVCICPKGSFFRLELILTLVISPHPE
jgi:hypothetical protein